MCDEELFIVLLLFIISAALLALYVRRKLSPTLKTGGFKGTIDAQDVLLVDVANMYVGWYMEKNGRNMPFIDQSHLFDDYMRCMHDHHARFSRQTRGVVNYVVKNFKYSSGAVMVAPRISDETWAKLRRFCKTHDGAHITVAEDYAGVSPAVWKSTKHHYVRARDDYMCFHMAQHYKKKYINAVIMSDDNFKDYDQFGLVPPFSATYIRASGSGVTESKESIKPRPNTLGQMSDYKMVKITTEFNFRDKRFVKTSGYKIPAPGNVW